MSAEATSSALLRAESLEIGYSPAERLAGPLDLELRPAELVCLLGPNGCGKTTLLRTLAGLQKPLAGAVSFDGEDLAGLSGRERARRLSVVLTGRPGRGELSVAAAVALGRHPHTGWSGHLSLKDRSVIEWALRTLSIEVLADRSVAALSDGEVQRVLVARALAQEPRVLLLDEPTAFLDLRRRVELFEVLAELARDRQIAILVSTHDLDLALSGADRVWLLEPRGLLEGGPEDLALAGHYDRLFGDAEVRFDSASGGFRRVAVAGPRARIVGQGDPAFWARRVAARCGYVVVDGLDADVEITCHTAHRFTVGRRAASQPARGKGAESEGEANPPAGARTAESLEEVAALLRAE